MPGPSVLLSTIPTGGGVRLDMPDYLSPEASGWAPITVSRAVSGSTFTQIYSGDLTSVYVDVGDGLPAPLSSGTAYVYQVADARGTTTIGPVVPVCSIISTPDRFTQLLIRLLQSGVDNMEKPDGIKPMQVTDQMPQGGWQALPFMVVNLDTIRQSELGIGQQVPNPDQNNDWAIWVNANRTWRVTILSASVEERDWYRDTTLAMFQALLASVFAPIGMDVSHRFQANSSPAVNVPQGETPGLYTSDLMLDLNGVFNVAVLTGYGVIQQIVTSGTLNTYGSPTPTVTDVYTVPLVSGGV